MAFSQDIGIRGGGSNPPPVKAKKPPRRPPAPPPKAKRRVTLTIMTDPAECEIYLNDAYRGTTAARNGKLLIPDLDTSLTYTLRVYKRGLGEELQSLKLDDDREMTISIKRLADKQKPEDTADTRPVPPPDKPNDTKPNDTRVAENKPPENKPPDAKPQEDKKPVEVATVKPPENKPPEVKTPDSKPLDTIKQPSDSGTKTAGNRPPQSEMVLIPAGEFLMGLNANSIKQTIDNEKPQHKVLVPAFYIDVYEVTNTEYKQFCDATNRPYPPNPSWDRNYFLGKPNNPVVNVTWEDANAYAQWVGKRLPTEEEWEKAARSTDGRVWPWGKDLTTALSNLDGNEDGYGFTAPVGSFRTGASVYGVQDLIGNVWEWTSSSYKPYPGGSNNDKRYQSDFRVIRGGGYQAPADILRSAGFRFPSEPGQKYEATGFRCARSL